ncbi:hypothetical protein SLA2020_345160 [Shorea laevis]
MKIMVAIKRVMDYAVKVRVKPEKPGVETHNVKVSMNPFCEMALEEALRIKESGLATEVVAAAWDLYPLTVAKVLKRLVGVENPGLLILGKQGKCWPGLLGWPQGIFASKVVLDKEKQVATVDREVDGGLETLCLDLPPVVQVTEPPKRKAGVILSSVDELNDKLKDEAHVL